MSLKFTELKNPIEVNLKEFILEGKFDCLKMGVTKSWLSNNFIKPDDVMAGETYESSPIWRYGNIELHFYKNKLWMIFSDYVDELTGGGKIKLDKWILTAKRQTTINDWIGELNQNIRNFSVVHHPAFEQIMLVLNEEDNGVVLTFINGMEHATSPNNFTLGAIQLWSKKLTCA